MGNQRDGRPQDEGQPHNHGVLDGVGGDLGAYAQLLLHQRPQPQVAVLGYFVGHLPRLVVGHTLPLEQHYQLGQLLGGVLLQFTGLALDFGPLHVLFGAGSQQRAGGHGYHAGESAGETGDDNGGLALYGHGDAGHQRHDTEQAVLGAEHYLAQAAQAGDAPALGVHFRCGGVVGGAVEGASGSGLGFG